MFDEAKERILAVVGPLLGELDLDIFDFEIKRLGRNTAVQLFIDHEQGGINIDDCSKVNKAISRLIEEEELLLGNYTVEVSSPGLDWPLKNPKDYTRVKGSSVKFHLKEKLADKLEHDGIVKDVQEDYVTVFIKDNELNIPFTIIQKAVQIIN